MLSSTAEKLYWACRYIERAEMTSRLLDVAYRISLTNNKENKIPEKIATPPNIGIFPS